MRRLNPYQRGTINAMRVTCKNLNIFFAGIIVLLLLPNCTNRLILKKDSNNDHKESDAPRRIVEQNIINPQQNNTLSVSKHISINGFDIQSDKIPFDWHYELPKEYQTLNDTSVNITRRVFSSDNKEYVALSTERDYYYNNMPIRGYGKFELMDENGNKIWTKEIKDRAVTAAYISNNLTYIHTIWSLNTESEVTFLLKCYNKEGKEIYTDSNMERLYCSANKEVIYYIKNSQYSHEQANQIYCANVAKGTKWVKQFDSEVNINTVSRNGEYLICFSNGKSYCIKDNATIWQQDYDKVPGTYELTDDGKYGIRFLNDKSLEFYNNETLAKIFIISRETVNGQSVSPFGGYFVENEKNIIAVSYLLAPKETALIFYDYKGNKLGVQMLSGSSFCNNVRIISNSNRKYSIFYDGVKIAEYLKNWQ